MNKISKVISRETLAITESFTNGFAQQVYKLEDGTVLYLDYDRTRIEIVKTEELETPDDEIRFINSLPDDEQ